MYNTTILECRQKESNNVKKNGEWENTLSTYTKIDPGDTISLKSCFIDTLTTSTGAFVFDNDLDVDIQCCVYNYDWETTQKNYPVGANHPNGLDYVLCTKKGGGTLSNYVYIEKVKFSFDDAGGETWGGFNAKFKYTDINGDTVKHNFKVGLVNKDRTNSQLIEIDKVVKDGSFTLLTSSKQLQLHRTKYDGIHSKSAVTKDTYSPKVFDFKFTIDAGTYTPDNLARFISSKISVNSTSKYIQADPVESAFLHTSNDFDSGGNGPNMVREDGNDFFDYNSSANRYIGSNQMSLLYDSNQQKFYWEFIHMPQYDNQGNIVTKFIAKGSTSEFFTAGKAGGVFFTDLQPSSLWEDMLKFNMNDLQCKFKHVNKVIHSQDANFPVVVGGLKAEKNITDGFNGLDIAVQKNNDFFKVPTPLSGLTSVINSQTRPIYGGQVIISGTVNTPYFLIDIDTKYESNFVTEENIHHSIRGIVSTYYSIDSYTTSGSDASIIYEHISNKSVLLKSLYLRILDPEKNVPDDIGNDNTIFLQINKKNPVQPYKVIKDKNNKD